MKSSSPRREIILTKEDVDNLFELLKLYFPNTQKVHSRVLKNAWHLLLEPYGPNDVKEALTAQLRENRNFPDAQAIAVKCSAFAVSTPETNAARCAPPTPAELKSHEKLISWQEQWHEELRQLGLPTLREALERGTSPRDWRLQLEGAGAWQ